MEYASVYALQNWARKDLAGGIKFDNLKLIRAFENHEGSEKGFMCVPLWSNLLRFCLHHIICSLVHVDMVCIALRRILGTHFDHLKGC
jgi:hypothetical protein